jgi:hypothetical protein
VFDNRPVREVAANVSQQGEGWRPAEVYHARLGLRWRVLEVLQAWIHPGWPERTYGKPVVERKYRLRVCGPLPGRAAEQGEFIMIATAYGDRDQFWIRPDARA